MQHSYIGGILYLFDTQVCRSGVMHNALYVERFQIHSTFLLRCAISRLNQ